MRQDFDVAIIGASVGGLAAATLLARHGKRVLLLEKELAVPEISGALFALDPEIVARLQLFQHGLRFVRRDMALTGWDDDDGPLTISRDRRASARAITALSAADAQAWGPFQAMLHSSARVLRRWWWHPHLQGRAEDMLWSAAARARFARDCVTGAEDFLRLHFESPRLIALLLADAVAGGFAPSEPGSALALIWRAAQEMTGLQASSAVPETGTLNAALRSAARAADVTIRMGTKVTAIRTVRGTANGVVLSDDEEVAARTVISSLSRAMSETLSGLETGDADGSVGTAQINIGLSEGASLGPDMMHSRIVLTPSPEDYADVFEAARAGKLPSAQLMVCLADGPRKLSLTLPLVAVSPTGGWSHFQAPLAALAVKALTRHIPGIAKGLSAVTVTPPQQLPRPTLAHLVAPAGARAHTRVRGLYLCGCDAEPVPCVSGRAGRFAAHFVRKGALTSI